MKGKKAFIRIIGWIVFALAIILLILLIKSDMGFKAVVDGILGLFGK